MGYGGNRDGGLGKMLSGLREPEEERSRPKGEGPARQRKPKKEKPSYGKKGRTHGFDQDDFEN